ncbi:hypothetical protein [Prosthecobacter vanneervenii]|uniref:Uncharacterized protein YlxW (UPF0749 family) n=1 Tax=Prosthecobacter vanneervenii TaxID=48466 RepID=A0A7W7YBH7_9BACT|nr:hypothetical protein [Prosthecobacter vanneervenii]MBB5033158.1 uncharacterized protein YlxW (UPF0749 family) [Prosthecobacter vanneervenii]
MITLASSTDISSVPADFVKYFMIMVGFVITGLLAYRKGTAAKGTKDEPLNVAQPLEVKKRTEYARKEETQSELDKLENTLNAMNRESVRQAQHTSEELASVAKAGAEREGRLMQAVHDMEKRFTQLMINEVKGLHDRLNPVSESVAGHKASLAGHETRLASLERTLNDNVSRLHQRFDDLMKSKAKN